MDLPHFQNKRLNLKRSFLLSVLALDDNLESYCTLSSTEGIPMNNFKFSRPKYLKYSDFLPEKLFS